MTSQVVFHKMYLKNRNTLPIPWRSRSFVRDLPLGSPLSMKRNPQHIPTAFLS